MASSVLFLIAIAQVFGPRPTAAVGPPTALFNGKNLAGWTYHLEKPDAKPADVWSVKDGVIHCTGTPAGYLITKESDFENYVLSLDWRWPEKGGNNGVLVHVTNPGELGVWPKSFEVQLKSGDAGELWVIGTTLQIDHPDTHVVDRRHKNLLVGAEKPVGEWNTVEITCIGGEIKVKVNGYLVNQARDLSEKRGAIALQSEGKPIEFRNVELRKAMPIYRRAQQQPQQQRRPPLPPGRGR